jgi:hypothetical protein
MRLMPTQAQDVPKALASHQGRGNAQIKITNQIYITRCPLLLANKLLRNS